MRPDYFSRLKEAGVPEEQAHVIADGLQKSLEIQNAAFENARKKWEEQDETKRQELATKQDLALEIEKVRLGIEALRNETTNKISDTMVKIEQAKSSLIKFDQMADWDRHNGTFHHGRRNCVYYGQSLQVNRFLTIIAFVHLQGGFLFQGIAC